MTRGGKRPGAGRPRVTDRVQKDFTLRAPYWQEMNRLAMKACCSVHELLRQMIRAGHTPEAQHEQLIETAKKSQIFLELADDTACLDGVFTADELAAIVVALRKIERTKAGKPLLK